jgi:hypothetical protein
VEWWAGYGQVGEIEEELSKLLPPARSRDSERNTWGDEDGNRFDVLRDGQGIAEIDVRLDVRNLSVPFLNRIVELARRHGLLVVTEDRQVLQPSLKELLAAIHRSRCFAYVSDPEGFLSQLAKKD